MAVKIIFDKRRFARSFTVLPKEIGLKLATSLTLLENNPFDSRLHTKKLSGPLAGLFSFRIGREWRVLFQFLDKETVMLIDVAHRKDIYR